MEFCFFKDEQDGSWKLDWQQFARFQPMNWEDFVRGKGEDIAGIPRMDGSGAHVGK